MRKNVKKKIEVFFIISLILEMYMTRLATNVIIEIVQVQTLGLATFGDRNLVKIKKELAW